MRMRGGRAVLCRCPCLSLPHLDCCCLFLLLLLLLFLLLHERNERKMNDSLSSVFSPLTPAIHVSQAAGGECAR